MSPDPRTTELEAALVDIRLVDTHEHLGVSARSMAADVRWSFAPAEREWTGGQTDVLRDIFGDGQPYLQADLIVAGASPDAVARLFDPSSGDLEARLAGVSDAWDAVQHTGYGAAARLVASEVYGLDRLSAEGLRSAQSRLDELRQPGEMLRLLDEDARLDHVQIDDHRWVSEPDPAGPAFFFHDLSWWTFCNGEIDLDQIYGQTGIEVKSIDDLREAMASLFARYAPLSIACKSPHAYTRPLRWAESSNSVAASALKKILAGSAIEDAHRLALGDWCWSRGVELAIEHSLPFKVHTGYLAGNSHMRLHRVNPVELSDLLAYYPKARFVLMHGGYPYCDELIALAKHYQNVWIDLCWAWAISPYRSAELVRQFIHTVPVNKLFVFGGDTSSPTNVLAYSIQARRWLTRALTAEVQEGYLSEQEAIRVANRLMHENQYSCFDIDSRRIALKTGLAH